MIFDNVQLPQRAEDGESYLTDFWPPGDKGAVLITARDEASLGQFIGGQVKYLNQFEEEDGVSLLLKLSKRPDTKENQNYARRICSRVDFLPLAVNSTASLLKMSKVGLDEYLEEYSNVDLIRKSKPLSGPEGHYKYTLETVWKPQFAHLAQKSPDSRRLLHILALLDPDGIREKLLLESIEKTQEPGLQSLSNIKELRENLVAQDLVYRNAEIKKIWMHRVIQGCCQVTMMDANAYQQAFDCAFHLINTIWPVPERHNRWNGLFWPAQQELVPHVERLAEHYRAFQEREPKIQMPQSSARPLQDVRREFAELLYNAGW